MLQMSIRLELHKEMRAMVKKLGCEIVANGQLTNTLVAKFGEGNGKFRNAIQLAQRFGVGEKILLDRMTVSDWPAYVTQLQKSFAAYSRLGRAVSDYIVESYVYALGYMQSVKMDSFEDAIEALELQKIALKNATRIRFFGIAATVVGTILLSFAVYFIKFDNVRIPQSPALKVEKLIAACSVGDAQYASELLHSGAYINSRDSLGMTPMHYAARLGSVELLDSLQKFNPDVSLKNNADKTPLEEAVGSNFAYYVEKILRSKSHEWMQANYERLHRSAKTEQMKNLLDDAWTKIDQMKAAIQNGDVALFDRSLAYRSGKDLHYKDADGETWLHYAAKIGNMDMLKHLLSLGLKVDTTDKFGRMPESYALNKVCKNYLYRYRLKDQLIFKSVQKNDKSLFSELVAYGANVNARDDDGVPLVHYAVRYNFPMLAELQKAGADIYAKNRNHETALFVAVYKNNLEVAKKLMDMGLSVHDKNANGKTPMTVVKNKTSKYLLDFTYKDDFFVSTIRRHVLDSAKYYLRLGANIDYVDRKTNHAAIHYAVENDDVKALKLLVANRADLTLRYLNKEPVEIALLQKKMGSLKFLLQNNRSFAKKIFDNGKSLMHEAVLMNAAESWMDILLQYGAHVDAIDKDGKTPLYYAILKNNAPRVSYLIARRAYVSRIDSEGNQPIHVAACYAGGEVVRALVSAGADPFVENSEGNKPVAVAKNCNNESAEDELDNYSLLGKAKKGLRSVTNAGAKLWEKVKSLAD